MKTDDSSIFSAEKSSVACETCTLLVDLLHDVFDLSVMFEDCVAEFADYLCVRLHIRDQFICQGIINGFKVVRDE